MIRNMVEGDIPEVVRLHVSHIGDSTLAELGADFIRGLYDGLISSRYGVNYVYEEGLRLIGFISSVSNTSRFLKEMLLMKGLSLAAKLAINFSPKKFYAALESFSYLRKTQLAFIKAELLFIAVEPHYRRKGIGERLIDSALNGLKERRIVEVKVTTVTRNRAARRLLEKMGFHLKREFKLFGKEMNLYSFNLK